MERRLSAIFAADMVGFSRLMEADEIGTLRRQKAHRNEVISPAINDSRGRIVKDMGDGILAEFPSVVEAVQCAVAIQRLLAEQESEVSDDRRIQYRIGINLGDIVGDHGDIFGDGVNVAARLEQMAEPGGICISGTAYDQMRSNLDVGYASLGNVQVKNIQRPIRAYKVLTDPQHAGTVINVNHQTSNQIGWGIPALVAIICLVILAGGTWWWMFQPAFNAANQDTPTKGQSATVQKANIIPSSLPFDKVPDPMVCDVEGDSFHPSWHTEGSRSKKSPIRGTLYIICPTQRFAWNGHTIPINWFDEAGNGYTDCDYRNASGHLCWITIPKNQLKSGERPISKSRPRLTPNGGSKSSNQNALPAVVSRPPPSDRDQRFAAVEDETAFVHCVQRTLVKLGYSISVIDGELGPETLSALVAHQAKNSNLRDLPAFSEKTSGEWCAALDQAHPELAPPADSIPWLNFEFAPSVTEEQSTTIRSAAARIYHFFLTRIKVGPRIPIYIYGAGEPSELAESKFKRSGSYPSRSCTSEYGFGFIYQCTTSKYFNMHHFAYGLRGKRMATIYSTYASMMAFNITNGNKARIGPAWLRSGFGTYIGLNLLAEQNIADFEERLEGFRSDGRYSEDSLALYANSRMFHRFGDRNGVALTAVHRLIAGRDLSLLAEFIKLSTSGVPWKQAFESQFGITVEDYYAEFDQLRKRSIPESAATRSAVKCVQEHLKDLNYELEAATGKLDLQTNNAADNLSATIFKVHGWTMPKLQRTSSPYWCRKIREIQTTLKEVRK